MSDSEVTPTPILDERPQSSLSETDPKTIAERYVVVDHLGEGGMGKVYKAIDSLLQREVAVKILPFSHYSDEQFKRFQQEARASSKLSHPGIVAALDFGATDDRNPFFVMELIEGETLSDFLDREGILDLIQFKSIFRQVAEAMQHAHSQGIVHRDLKTSNIAIQPDGEELRASVLDFGIAKVLQDQSELTDTKTGQIVGSPRCISPEQIMGAPLDGRCDIYSLGCVMYEALTASPPFQGESPLETMQMHLNEIPSALSEFIDGTYPDELEELIERVLAKEAEDRFEDMSELISALERIPDFIETENEEFREGPSPGVDRKISTPLLAAMTLILAISAMLALNHFSKKEKPLSPPGGTASDRSDHLPLESPRFLREFKVKRQSDGEITVIKGKENASNTSLKYLIHAREVFDKDIELAGCKKITSEAAIYLRQIPLNRLSLANTRFNDEGLRLLTENPDNNILCASLRWLTLNNTGISDVGVKHLQNFTAMEAVDLRGTEITRNGLETLLETRLDRLNISNCRKLRDEDMTCLANKRLRLLNACGTDFSIKAASVLPSLPNLRELLVNEAENFNDACLERLTNCSNLEKLACKSTSITPEGLRKLRAAKKLTSLAVGFITIKDDTIDSVTDIVNLENLSITRTSITDKGLAKIARLKQLKNLNLSYNTKITREGVDFLRSNLPDCKISGRAVGPNRDFFGESK